MKVDDLNAVAPWVAKIAAKPWLKFQFVLLRQFLPDLFAALRREP